MSILDELVKDLDPAKLESLLDEIGDKNRVRVVKFSASRPNVMARAIRKRVMDEEGTSKLMPAALTRLDELRMLIGLQPRYLAAFFHAFGGELVGVTPNIRTNVGKDYTADALGKSGSRPAVAEYMALTENAGGSDATHTTLPGEITTGGLQRAQATYAHTVGTTVYTLAHTFPSTGTFTGVQMDALLNAASVGTLFLEATFLPTPLIAGDSITVTHTVNV